VSGDAALLRKAAQRDRSPRELVDERFDSDRA
jgi:hypothetical protein